MSRKLSKHYSEAKMTRWERKHVTNGNKAARQAARAFNRASRQAWKQALREAA